MKTVRPLVVCENCQTAERVSQALICFLFLFICSCCKCSLSVCGLAGGRGQRLFCMMHDDDDDDDGDDVGDGVREGKDAQ